jgi:serine/threonine protein phosphatase PrpC
MSLLSISSPQSHHAVRPPRIEAFGLTDVGRVREHNEDCFAVLPDLGLFVVADGIGGRACGEIASRMAIDSMREVLADTGPRWSRRRVLSGNSPAPLRVVAGIELANERIVAAAEWEPAKQGMGTTVVSALVSGDRLVLAHVGDSRAYRLRGTRLELLTEDHSVVNEHIRAGLLAPEKADSSPFRHIITRAVGTRPTVEVETRIVRMEPDDVYLLCSDGLSSVVEPWELAAILLEHHDLGRAAGRLIERANALGGPDNITAVLVRVGDSAG